MPESSEVKAETNPDNGAPKTIRNGQRLREWTVMCYFAGDDPLSALVVTQIKEIKDAGFQPDTDVLIHYDSNKKGAPTRLYNVNYLRKDKFRNRDTSKDPGGIPPETIGDGRDPFVRNFIEDIVDPDDIEKATAIATGRGITNRPGSAAMINTLTKPDTVMADDALRSFVTYCQENHPAKHYMLVLFGHGMIVGSDSFLPDANPVSGISLPQMGEIVGNFCKDVKDHGTLELLALHSCSMGALEVAYQLKGTAKYMIASEGFSYVGAWPYRQLLKKLYANVEKPVAGTTSKENAPHGFQIEPAKLIKKLYYLALFGATDFMLSGYSLDLGLINLDEKLFDEFEVPFTELVKALKPALCDEITRKLIVAAHGQSQSYWGENYTDLYDFCECVSAGCADVVASIGSETVDRAVALRRACEKVIDHLEDSKHNRRHENCLIHCSEYFGPLFEYSHGLSIYFPWARPRTDFGVDAAFQLQTRKERESEDNDPATNPLEMYSRYLINQRDDGETWFSFLDEYWTKTQRGLNRRDQRANSPNVILREPGSVDLTTGFPDNSRRNAPYASPKMGSIFDSLDKETDGGDKDVGGTGAAPSGSGSNAGALDKDTGGVGKDVGGTGAAASGGGSNDGSLGKDTGGVGKDVGGTGAGASGSGSNIGSLDKPKDVGGTGKDTGGTGSDSDAVVKNFPVIMRKIKDRRGKDREFPISEGLRKTFEKPQDDAEPSERRRH